MNATTPFCFDFPFVFEDFEPGMSTFLRNTILFVHLDKILSVFFDRFPAKFF